MRLERDHFPTAGGVRKRRRRAFTLPEVLATMTLMIIVLPVVASGVSGALGAASRAKFTAQAATLGEARLSELVTTGQWTTAAAGGDFGADWPQYRWECQTLARDFGATEIVLKVIWTERGVERSLLLSTMVSESSISAGATQ